MEAPGRWKLAAIAAFGISLAVNVQGCTIIGLAVGSSDDARNSRGGPERLLAVRTGHRVVLRLLDGSSIAGRFQGLSRDSTAAPADPEKWASDSIVAAAAVRPTSYRPLRNEMNEAEAWRAQRNILSKGTRILLETSTGECSVPLDSIGQVVAPTSTGLVTGLLVGATLDAIVIAGLHETFTKGPDCSGPDVPGWNPFYAKTGPVPASHPSRLLAPEMPRRLPRP
jgi:hypothetical protein